MERERTRTRSLGLLFLLLLHTAATEAVISRAESHESLHFSKRSSPAAGSAVELPDSLRRELLHHSRPSPRAFSHRLRGRREGEVTCGLPASTVLEHNPVELSEAAEAIQALWVGKDEILIVASDTKIGGETTVWIGATRGYGVFHFTPDPKAIQGTVSPASLQVSLADSRNTVIVLSHARDLLYTSSDAGRSWNKHKLPVQNFETSALHLSRKSSQHLVLHSQDQKLYHSLDRGMSWSQVADKVGKVQFASDVYGRSKEYLFFNQGTMLNSSPLFRLDINNNKIEEIDSRAFKFQVDGRYLFVSRQNYTGSSEKDAVTRRLYVSNTYLSADPAHITFTEVQLPSVKPEQFYVVMATHESGAFIHVAAEPDKPSGALYVSDSSGSRYTLSLKNHLYKQVHLSFGMSVSVDDFFEVKSMRGVYITTMVTDAKGDEHVTMITFNNGGQWQRLRPPTSSECHYPACSLHLHLQYSRVLAPRYNISLTAPLTVQSAVGIILAHGSLGPVRDDAHPRLYVSSDGGWTWKDPGLPDGTFVYGIADYGNIIAVAHDTEHVEFIWFSHDRGECFHKEQLESVPFSLNRGLLMDPAAASLYAFVMGVEGTGKEDEWRLITLNFASLLNRKCQHNDYHNVSEHVASADCLLGYRSVYNLTTDDAVCYNEAGYNYKAIDSIPCKCMYLDYECDYGFIRDHSSCVKDPHFSLSSVCPPGASTYKESKSGFRLIPGDKCKMTAESKKLLTQQEQPCTDHEEDSGFDQQPRKTRAAAKVFGAIVIILALLLAAGLSFYCYLRCRGKAKSHERVFYQKLPVTDSRFSATEDDSDDDLLAAS